MLRGGGRFLVLLISLGPVLSSGCLGGASNPSYFPYYLPPGDIIQTHAKPPGRGYFANFDPNAVLIEVEPTQCSKPIGQDQVVIATVFDDENRPRRKRRVEWILEGPGEILEVDESGMTAGRGYLVNNQRGITYTAIQGHSFTRGNDDPRDDFRIEPGQTWCIVRSMKPGETVITAYAPEIFNHDKRTAVCRLRWLDGPGGERMTPEPLPEPRFAPLRGPTEAASRSVPSATPPATVAVAPPLRLSLPSTIVYQQVAPLQLQLHNPTTTDWDSVILECQLPESLEVVSTEAPEPTRVGQILAWSIGPVRAGTKLTRMIQVRPQKKGELQLTAIARLADGSQWPAEARAIVAQTGTLQLNLEVPEFGSLTEPTTVGLALRNEGNAPLEDLTTRLTLPEGLRGPDGQNPVEVRLAQLGPGESRRQTVTVQAARPGRYTLRGASLARGQATEVQQVVLEIPDPAWQLKLEGPTQVGLFAPSSWRIMVRPTGRQTPPAGPLAVPLAVRLEVPKGWRVRGTDANLPGAEEGSGWIWRLANRPDATKPEWILPVELVATTVPAGALEARLIPVTTVPAAGSSASSPQSPLASVRQTIRVNPVPQLQIDLIEWPVKLDVGQSAKVQLRIRNVGTVKAERLEARLQLTGPGQLGPGLAQTPREGEPRWSTEFRWPAKPECLPGETIVLEATLRGGATPGEVRLIADVMAQGISVPLREEQMLRVRPGS